MNAKCLLSYVQLIDQTQEEHFSLKKKTLKIFMKESFCHGRSLDDVIMEEIEIIFLSSRGHFIADKIDDYY